MTFWVSWGMTPPSQIPMEFVKPPLHPGWIHRPKLRLQSPLFRVNHSRWKGLISVRFGSLAVLYYSAELASFFFFGSNKSGAEQEINTLQNQLLALKEELESSQNEWRSDREDLYDAIDEIEVSIHSIEIKPPIQATQSKLTAIPHEAELRRWRYLGITRMGAVEQAFFHTGQSTKMVGKGDLTLGEWRLTQSEKELAILNHPKGKSITFKSTNSEWLYWRSYRNPTPP